MINNEKQVQEIAESINQMIEYAIKDRAPESDADHQLEELSWRFKDMLRETKMGCQDYEEQGLTFSLVESEGYLRAMLTIENLLESVTNYTKDKK
jgi:hypothetical protein